MTNESEIMEVGWAASRAVRDTMTAAHNSGKHAPDAPGKPAEWRGQTEVVHVMRAAGHLLEYIAKNIECPREEYVVYLAQAAGVLAVMIEGGGMEKTQAVVAGFIADEKAGLSLPHAVTRLAMAAAVKVKDGVK